MSTFGELVRELRKQKHITQRELAEILRVDFTYISKIENNRLEAPPSEDLIREIAKVLETDANELLDIAGKFDPKALQQVVTEVPEVGVLLRRIQNRTISETRLRQFLESLEDDNEDDSST